MERVIRMIRVACSIIWDRKIQLNNKIKRIRTMVRQKDTLESAGISTDLPKRAREDCKWLQWEGLQMQLLAEVTI